MKFSSLRSLALVAAMSIAVVASAAIDVVSGACSAVRRAASWLFDLVVPSMGVASRAADSAGEIKPKAQLQRADAHLARQIKRERPRVTPDWRMCPSV
jgi:hypothetical protein